MNIQIYFISSHDCNLMPSVYVRPVIKSQMSTDKEQTDGPQQQEPDAAKFDCPVFINRARQVCPLHLSLTSNQPKEKWVLAGTAVILDAGKCKEVVLFNDIMKILLDFLLLYS